MIVAQTLRMCSSSLLIIQKVEWRAFAAGTDHTKDYSPSLLQMGIPEDKPTYSIHSHPCSETKAIEERRSMGYDWGGNKAYGDWAIVRRMADPNTKNLPYPYEVIFRTA